MQKTWLYRESIIHFLLGSLLSVYTLFYFKSASIFSSFAFVALLSPVLVLNEFKRFGDSGIRVRIALFSLCLTSFFVYLVPMILGFIGIVPFITAIVMVVLFFYSLHRASRGVSKLSISKKHLFTSALGVPLIFVGLYLAELIPPVPLSISYIGIYHDVVKENGSWRLSYTRSKWKFWQNGDQTFVAAPGDKIHCFFRIFSPTRFKDKVQVRWLYKDPRQGWISADAIPIAIVGGRDLGFRGFTSKTNYQPGSWRVQVETTDNRELGRIYFDVVTTSAAAEAHEFKFETQ